MQKRITMVACTALLLFTAACSRDGDVTIAESQAASFVGSEQCQSCHATEYQQWIGSHHQLAMLPANSDSVLGNFDGVEVPYFESRATFSQRDEKFYATVENDSGEFEEFLITHTFGVTPLQQYLVEGRNGRKQALQFAWDSRSSREGGQRWFHLYPDEYLGAGDSLHWSGRYFNWNYMCAECHSTDLQTNYDLDSDRFDTRFAEISVGCEACHGPGSVHSQQAGDADFDTTMGFKIQFDDRASAAWKMNLDTGIAERSTANPHPREAEACGRCHARRSVAAPDYEYGRPLADTHAISLLEDNLYHADGRIQEEVYVYGSFVQSKMYAAGVTCSDCHNPHSGELRAGPDPNNTCATCHLATTFATAQHSPDDIGNCVGCHMPTTTYMGVDDRRDHSFRLPGTAHDPNHYGAVIAAGRAGNANDTLLAGISNSSYPAIARATMLSLLEPLDSPDDVQELLAQLNDNDALVRIGALRALRNQPATVRRQHGSQLLRDPIRSVRIEAALTFIDQRDLLPLEDTRAFASSAEDYRLAMMNAAAMPDAALNLAEFESRLGNTDAAAELFEHAIRIGSDLAQVQHAYGLYLVRSGAAEKALQHLLQATQIDSNNAQFAYVYGVALNSLGQPQQAIDTLLEANDKFAPHFDIGWALATMYRDAGDREAALGVAQQLLLHYPNEDRLDALISSL